MVSSYNNNFGEHFQRQIYHEADEASAAGSLSLMDPLQGPIPIFFIFHNSHHKRKNDGVFIIVCVVLLGYISERKELTFTRLHENKIFY